MANRRNIPEGRSTEVVSDLSQQGDSPVFVVVPLLFHPGEVTRESILSRAKKITQDVEGSKPKTIQVGTPGEFDRAIATIVDFEDFEDLEAELNHSPIVDCSEVLLEYASPPTQEQLKELGTGFKSEFGLADLPRTFNFSLDTYPVADYRAYMNSFAAVIGGTSKGINPTR